MLYRTVIGYLKKKSDPYYELGLERERWKPQGPLQLKPGDYANYKKLNQIRPKLEMHISEEEESALNFYLSSEGSDAINRYNRNKHSFESAGKGGRFFVNKELEEHIDKLQNATSKRIEHSLIVWRGMKFNEDHNLIKQMIKLDIFTAHPSREFKSYRINVVNINKINGFVFTEPSFVSTSVDPSIAAVFAEHHLKNPSILFKINVPDGAYGMFFNSVHIFSKDKKRLDFYNTHVEENELLLPKGTKFRVLSATSTVNNLRKNPEIRIDLEVIV